VTSQNADGRDPRLPLSLVDPKSGTGILHVPVPPIPDPPTPPAEPAPDPVPDDAGVTDRLSTAA
jgi:hypothetical protein